MTSKRNPHIARSQYINKKLGRDRFALRLEIDEDGVENLYPLRKWHNKAEKAAFSEYDETHTDSP